MSYASLNVSPTLHNQTSMKTAVNIAFSSAQYFITSCDESNMFKPIKLLSKQAISLYLMLPPPPPPPPPLPPLSYLFLPHTQRLSYTLTRTHAHTQRD